MATKTLTITEDAYNLLVERKLPDESFSMEIRRLLTEKKKGKLSDFFGILSDKEGGAILAALEKARRTDIRLGKEKAKSLRF